MVKGFFYNRLQRRWLYSFLALLVTVSVSVGSVRSSQAIPWINLLMQGVQVIQLSNISDQEEIQVGQQINQQLIRSGQIRLQPNSGLNDYVNQVGQRLAVKSTRPNISYTFQVLEDNSINASATAGGFIYVNTGLLKAADNEAQLAGVLAHEIGHISSRHLIKQMRQAAIVRGITTTAGLERNQFVQIGVDLALHRPHSRQDEFEADQQGLQTVIRAGYAPSGMITFMQKLLGSDTVPTFLSRHPATHDRVAALQRAIDPQTANVGSGLDSANYQAIIRSLSRTVRSPNHS